MVMEETKTVQGMKGVEEMRWAAQIPIDLTIPPTIAHTILETIAGMIYLDQTRIILIRMVQTLIALVEDTVETPMVPKTPVVLKVIIQGSPMNMTQPILAMIGKAIGLPIAA
jgi:hypothetical protein